MQSTSVLNLLDETPLVTFDSIKVDTYKNIVDEVEILPVVMNFMDAYEGKEFCKKFTLRNNGKKSAMIRIGLPTANAFRIKQIKEWYILSPGLIMSRMIKMKYTRAFAIHDAYIPIYINDQAVRYPLTITLNHAEIIVEPTEVNFGRVDAVSSVVSQTVVVRNEGTKNAAFCIDLGRNELELIVEPTKGILQASESVILKLEVMGFYEGPFQKEFWIKTDPPKRVTVVGEFITPRIIPTFPKAYADFSMVIFPRLYIGQTLTKSLLIKNVSSCDVMFCMKGVFEKKYMLYKEAIEVNENFRNFRVTPLEGRLGSQQTTVVEIVFEPIETSENHAVCFIQVIRVDCMDVDKSVVIRDNEIPEPAVIQASERSRSSLVILSTTVPQAGQDDFEQEEAGDPANLVTEEKIAEAESFRVCFYGDKEKAEVWIQPENICLNDILVDVTHTRVLKLQNVSSYLSITVNYVKIPFVDIIPPKIYLKPKETREIIVKITPKRAGIFSTRAVFELMVLEYYETYKKKVVGQISIKISFIGYLQKKVPKTKFVTGLTPNNNNEVGFMTHDVRFNTAIPKMKAAVMKEDSEVFEEDDSALIAFPNDRPKSLRPWREGRPCKTIFAKLPRVVATHDEYSYSPSEVFLKRQNRNYYDYYLSEKHDIIDSRIMKKMREKNLENLRKHIFERFSCEIIEEKKVKKEIEAFVPLSPIILQNVKIQPKYIRLQRVAPISNVEHLFTITNNNPFSIFIYVTSVKPGIYFPQGQCKIVEPFEEKLMSLTCFAGLVGRYINLIQVIVNFCHLYTISVMVEVVPKMIHLDENVITFDPGRTGNVKFIELRNHLNSSISFSTETSLSRFKMEPPSGTILQKFSLLCAIKYENLPGLPDYCELVLTSEGGGAQIIQISRKKEKPSVEITPSKLNLFNLPLNIKTAHFLRIKNHMNYDVCFIVVNPTPLVGVEISPCQGVIQGDAEIVVKVTILIDNSEGFDTKFEFTFEDQYGINVGVHARIAMPMLEIKPESIVNRQLIPFAYRRNIFYVKNESTCDCVVRFDLDQYEYFRVTLEEENMDDTIHNKNLELLPGEVKTLYLHFHPMDALTESFYMPVIINDIVGPPTISNTESTTFKLGRKKSSTKLPCLRITSICGTTTLHFSTLKLTFVFAMSDSGPASQLQKFFTAKNIGNDPVDFCIKIDKILEQFQLSYHSGTNIQKTDVSLICKLQPGESTIFSVLFIPTLPGDYVCCLPIYVRNYLEGCIFNYLRFVGVYEKPIMETFRNTYYLGCAPVGFKSAVMLDLQLRYHGEHCQVGFDTPPPDVTITFRERAKRMSRNVVKTKIVFVSSRSASVFADINFHCSCGAKCVIKLIAFTDNCFLSHYGFFNNNEVFIQDTLKTPCQNLVETMHSVMSEDVLGRSSESMNFNKYLDAGDLPENQNVWNFPFFPLKPNEEHDSFYENEMRDTLKFVERWIYSQGFYQTDRFHIPYTIALPPIQKKEGKKNLEPLILNFLVELGGNQVREASISSKVPSMTPKNIALHFYTTYTNMLLFLEEQNAILPHVIPELLLTYEYYQIICEYFPETLKVNEIFDEATFNAYSARCYLDLVLQSIKIFILDHIKMFDCDMPRSIDIEGTDTSCMSVVTSVALQEVPETPNSNIYTKNEQLLLYWLQYHFDHQKRNLWKPQLGECLHELKPKDIKFFKEDLSDSLVFACVTSFYCPYLASALSTMYVPPNSFEEYHHNACTIIKVWDYLQLSYVLEPMDIVEPNAMNMFLLTLYLYEILPSFYPKESLDLEAKLTQTKAATISLTNSSDHPLHYAVIFFGNESESFTSETDMFKIAPKKTGTLKIQYQAKKISSQKAILVLSGERPGQKYGKSRAINLNGITNLNYTTKYVEFICEGYSIHKMKIPLKSPYNLPDTYELFYNILKGDPEEGEEVPELILYSWKEYVLGKVPRMMYSKEYKFDVINAEDGFTFEPIICCQLTPVRVYKMFMVGQHGDWCFEIKIIPQITKENHEVVNVSLPRGFNSQACTCREKATDIPLICPRTIRINIPSKNNLSYKSTREMFIACTDDQFLAFWRKFLPPRAVFNVLRSFYSTSDPSSEFQDQSEFFMKTHRYNIFTEVDPPFTAQKQVTIEDVTSEKTTEILIHANPDFNLTNGSTFLELENFSKTFKRFYKLNFYET